MTASVIEAEHVSKEFRLGQLTSLGQGLRNGFNRLLGRPVRRRAPFMALDDVSFAVRPGEVLGIIGHNGAGKSTLLKILAGISRPTRGQVAVHGRVAPLIEVGAGMVPDMTGRENIFLNAAILGMKRAEIKRKFDEIVDFSELEEFIDTPVKRYSSGMQVRLGFAIATAVESEILIVDEVLAVGDIAFQRKCFDRMERLIQRQEKTVLLVSHNLRQVGRLCTRAIMLDHGRVAMDGDALAACTSLLEASDKKTLIRLPAGAAPPGPVPNVLHLEDVVVESVRIEDSTGRLATEIKHGDDVTVRISIRVVREVLLPHVGLGVHTPDLLYLFADDSIDQLNIDRWEPGRVEVVCRVPSLPLIPGTYAWRIGIGAGKSASGIFYAEQVAPFQVVEGKRSLARLRDQGFFAVTAQWRATESQIDECSSVSLA